MSKKGERWTAEEYASSRNSPAMVFATLSIVATGAVIFLTSADYIPGMVGWPLACVSFAAALATVMVPMWRRPRLAGFRPSKLDTAYARTSSAWADPVSPWLTKGQHSHVWLITAPNVTPDQAERPRNQLDAALREVIGPKKPNWYFRLEKTGYLILFVPGVIVLAACLLAGAPLTATWIATIMAMVWLGYPLAGVLQNIARRQATQQATTIVQPVLEKTSAVVRPAQPDNVRAIGAALEGDVDQAIVQALAFAAAGTDAEADRAAEELVSAAGRVAPGARSRAE